MEKELVLLKNANRNLDWLDAHFSELISEHNNEFVAVKEGKLVSVNSDLDGLLKELKAKSIDPATTLIKYITTTPIVL
ncbi:MAG: DUF5678 domain-containing protein [Candidatus Bathyarchaeota archaeon]